ncbi:MAG TPA: hypothetical protein PKE12_06265 [Kiritimatiellia bacterium]|nr:hypothetical protein [Kiritimatiellia bacterium]
MRGLFLALLAIGLAAPARATLDTPLHIGATASIANEFGVTLPGHAAAPGALVMVLWAPSNTVYAPSIDGQPHPLNPPVSNGLTAIGRSMAPALANSGRFSISLANPRPKSGRVFVRVFNKPTLEESSFYADSQIFTISGNLEFMATVGPTTNALDTADDDEDGLHNSWEKSYGSNPDNPDTDGDGIPDGEEHALGLSPVLADTDGDGMPDGHELRAGTAAEDASSYLGVATLQPGNGHVQLQWSSVAGKFYQVEGAADLVAPVFTNLTGVIPADPGDTTGTTITNALEGAAPLILRVRLVED